MKLYKIAWRNIFRNGRRTALSATAIGAASMGIVLLFSIINGMEDDLRYNIHSFYTGQIRICHKDYDKYEHLFPLHLAIERPYELVKRIRSLEGVSAISIRIRFPGLLPKGDRMIGVVGLGVDMESEREFEDLDRYLVRGGFPKGEREILISSELMRKLDLDIGDKVTVLATTMSRGSNAMTFKVVGIVQYPVIGLNENLLLLPLKTAQYLLRMGDRANEILVKLRSGVSEERFRKLMARALGDGLRAELALRTWKELKSSYSLVTLARAAYNVIALLFLLLGSSVIINTTMMAVYERVREIGTMSALGMEKGEIVRLFFTESLYIGLIGSAGGTALGYLISLILSFRGIDYSSAMEGMSFEVSGVWYPRPTLTTCIFVFAYSVAIASVTSIFPSLRAARVDPIKALRDPT